uniref:Vacuolar-sorting protein SNF8 n=1 Tax=Blastobotrys adeninivorans TaxID=409370 RepID=A0A060T6F7_BLAAD
MKKVGLAAFADKKGAFEDLSNTIQQTQAQQLSTQLAVFQSALDYFAVNHADEIRSNPQFRRQFAQMCTAIGVDPLTSSSSNKKGSLWGTLLGKDVSDFYFELAVRIIEICRLTRDVNGGLISVAETKTRLADPSQPRPINVTEDDIERAVDSLAVLGKGCQLVRLGRQSQTMIRSTSSELSQDQARVLEACQALGYVSVSILMDNLGWNGARCQQILNDMVQEGLLWIDSQGIEREYWIPSWML